MIKCYTCQNHQQDGNKHECKIYTTKTVYGQIQEQFNETCNSYVMTKFEKRRQYLKKKRAREPIDDRLVGIGVRK